MSYVPEHAEEFNRLEKQSTLPLFDYSKELQGLDVKSGACILDAGCGSGIVSRYLARTYPESQVIACDYTGSLIEKARAAASEITNITFDQQNPQHLEYRDGQFDAIISRFVFHHQNPEGLKRMVAELVRVLKPGGTLIVIDIDSLIFNLYPQTPAVTKGLQKLAASDEVDLYVGRKIPCLLAEAGLESFRGRFSRWNLKMNGSKRVTDLSMPPIFSKERLAAKRNGTHFPRSIWNA